jgi:pyruvate,orthophosphate dikinase
MDGPARHHPPARPAAARVPAPRRSPDRRGGEATSASPSAAQARCAAPRANPMLGHRGVPPRHHAPRSTEMQVRAIFEAACAAQAKGVVVMPEVMIPLVGMRRPSSPCARSSWPSAEEVIAEHGGRPRLPGRHHDRAAARGAASPTRSPRRRLLQLRHQRPHADDLGLSRDDMGKFLPDYVAAGAAARRPPVTIDVEGVGSSSPWGRERGRAARPKLKLGVCGEHGGDPTRRRLLPQGRASTT